MIVLMFFACSSEVSFQGTLVGNPGRGDALVAEGKDLVFHTAGGRANAAYYLPNSPGYSANKETVYPLDMDLDLLSSGDHIPLLQGSWAGIGLEFAEGITITGEGPNGEAFSLQTSGLFVELEHKDVLSISESSYIIELGSPGWISSADFEVESQLVVDGESEIVETLNFRSGLFLDKNGDGSLSEQEREENSLTETEEDWEIDEEEENDNMDADTNEPGEGLEESDFPDIYNDEIWEDWDEEEWEEDEEEWEEDEPEEASGCEGRSMIWLPFLALLGIRRRTNWK